MANIKSAEKRNRQNLKNRQKNRQVKSSVKSVAKKVSDAAAVKEGKNPDQIKNLFKTFASTVDSACRKGVIHWKTAARKKSRMAKKVNKAVK